MEFTSFYPGQQFAFMNSGIPLQGGFTDGGRSDGGITSAFFDSSAIFQSPIEPFRFDNIVSSPELINIDLHMGDDDAANQSPIGDLTGDGGSPIDPKAQELGQRSGQERRSSDEETNLTPAQSRRKAQNRAAQRAFRERKERHVKDLEAKLSALESSATNLASDNQRLKLALQRAITENEMLRATNGIYAPSGSLTRSRPEETSSATPAAGSDAPMYDDNNADSDSGMLLSSSAVWDYIVEHPLVKSGRVDITDTVNRLRQVAQPGRQGPIFPESEVKKAIEASRKAGGDALI